MNSLPQTPQHYGAVYASPCGAPIVIGMLVGPVLYLFANNDEHFRRF
jgi:hypothetical protein